MTSSTTSNTDAEVNVLEQPNPSCTTRIFAMVCNRSPTPFFLFNLALFLAGLVILVITLDESKRFIIKSMVVSLIVMTLISFVCTLIMTRSTFFRTDETDVNCGADGRVQRSCLRVPTVLLRSRFAVISWILLSLLLFITGFYLLITTLLEIRDSFVWWAIILLISIILFSYVFMLFAVIPNEFYRVICGCRKWKADFRPKVDTELHQNLPTRAQLLSINPTSQPFLTTPPISS